MSRFSLHSRSQLFACVVASAAASVAILGAVAMLFVDDGRTPWFAEKSPLARQTEACSRLRSSSERHACLRNVAKTSAERPVAAGDAPLVIAADPQH